MISANDFLMPDGKIDWQAYDKARIDAGEKCKKCGKHLLFPKGYPEECFACKDQGCLYHSAVQWIAENDEPTLRDIQNVQSQISVMLISDVFGVHPEIVAEDVIHLRDNE